MRAVALASLLAWAGRSEQLTWDQAKCIMSNRKFVFVGDSVTRYCYFALNTYIETGEPRESFVDGGDFGFGKGSSDYDDYELWTDWTRFGTNAAHRAHFTKEFDGGTSTEFYFAPNAWIEDDQTDGEESLESVAKSFAADDVVVFNGGLWYLLSDDDYMGTGKTFECGEEFTRACGDEYTRMIGNALDEIFGRVRAAVFRGTWFGGQASSASKNADWLGGIAALNDLARDELRGAGFKAERFVDVGAIVGEDFDVDEVTFDGRHADAPMCDRWNDAVLREVDRQLATGCLSEYEPTRDPTRVLTRDPTREPTRRPVSEPTPGPTPAPSFEPTRPPAADPTRNPTQGPTPRPSSRPPTASPSRRPAYEPTTTPSPRPTPQPTVDTCANGIRDLAETDVDCGGGDCGKCVLGQACRRNADCLFSISACVEGTCLAHPTAQPTTAPSPVPTLKPTAEPTAPPTRATPGAPTLKPTVKPSPVVPSLQPTLKPTPGMTGMTTTLKPTAEPTAPSTRATPSAPTLKPTVKPSPVVPSVQPTLKPTPGMTAMTTTFVASFVIRGLSLSAALDQEAPFVAAIAALLAVDPANVAVRFSAKTQRRRRQRWQRRLDEMSDDDGAGGASDDVIVEFTVTTLADEPNALVDAWRATELANVNAAIGAAATAAGADDIFAAVMTVAVNPMEPTDENGKKKAKKPTHREIMPYVIASIALLILMLCAVAYHLTRPPPLEPEKGISRFDALHSFGRDSGSGAGADLYSGHPAHLSMLKWRKTEKTEARDTYQRTNQFF